MISAKLSYLLQQCQDKTRGLIESCTRKRPDEGYSEAWRLLEANLWTAVYDRSCLCEERHRRFTCVPWRRGRSSWVCVAFRDCWLTLSEIHESAEMDNTPTSMKVSKCFSSKLLERRKSCSANYEENPTHPTFQRHGGVCRSWGQHCKFSTQQNDGRAARH